jgi:hypothetical protein
MVTKTIHVVMHFGDGSFKDIEVEATDPDEAVEQARDWVNDNAWLEVRDEASDEVLASTTLA